jgi:hypothetical protein
MPPQDVTGSELAQLFVDTGIDLTVLSAVATARELAPVRGITEALQTTSSPLTVQAGDGESIQPKVTGPVRSFGSMLASA